MDKCSTTDTTGQQSTTISIESPLPEQPDRPALRVIIDAPGVEKVLRAIDLSLALIFLALCVHGCAALVS